MTQIKSFFKNCAGAYIALAILLIACCISNENFRTAANLTNILRQCSYSGIVALGMTYVIIAGGIDLAVGSLFALSGVTIINTTLYLAGNGLSPVIATILGCFAGCCLGVFGGAINGLLINLGKLPPFIATLGTYSIYRSLALYFANSGTVDCYSNMAVYDCFSSIGGSSFLSLATPVWVMLILAIILEIMLCFTRYGKYTLATGASERVSQFSGINTSVMRFGSYAIVGMCIGIAAILFCGRMGAIQSSNAGQFYELDAIAAVVIGGASMAGGKGCIRGTIAGVLILGIVSNILDFWHIPSELQGTVKGLVILISVLTQRKQKGK